MEVRCAERSGVRAVKLVLQRSDGDCAIAAIATLSEQPYEDVFLEAAKVEPRFRGRSGLFLPHIKAICKRLGMTVQKKDRIGNWEDDDGLLVVTWQKGSRHIAGRDHLVAVSYGIIADSIDGTILPAEEFFARERAKPGAFLEWSQ